MGAGVFACLKSLFRKYVKKLVKKEYFTVYKMKH